jgi:AcrR family transcriptional regulator
MPGIIRGRKPREKTTGRPVVHNWTQPGRMCRNTDESPRTDRRVLRTREALRGALLGLMVERGWGAIDIQSLCERANIGRSTFYLHFPNKEELLKGSFGDLRTALRDQAKQRAPESTDQLAFVGGLIEHVHQQQLVFRAMLGRRSGH